MTQFFLHNGISFIEPRIARIRIGFFLATNWLFFNNEFHELNEFCDGFAGVALRFCTLSAPA